MKDMLENIRARFNCKKFNVWTRKQDNNRKRDSFFGGEYIYNGTLYYGNPFLVFFRSAHNSWYQTITIMEKEYPKIHGDIYNLECFEHTIIELSEDISYQLMRVPGGWIWMDLVFIPFNEDFSIFTNLK